MRQLSTFFTISRFTSNEGRRETFKLKTWHFAEAAAFFIFLVYAPVGSTEFFVSQLIKLVQAQHDAQEIRIEQLEAQIRLPTKIRRVEEQNLWRIRNSVGGPKKSTPTRLLDKRCLVSEKWSGRQDLNLRPLDPQSSALPNCATPRDFLL